MRSLLKIIFVLLLLPVGTGVVRCQSADVPQRVSKFKPTRLSKIATLKKEGFLPPDAALKEEDGNEGEYLETDGSRLTIEQVNFQQDGKAYELLSLVFAAARAKEPTLELQPGYGTAGFATDDQITFFRGPHFVRIRNFNHVTAANLQALIRDMNAHLDKGEGDFPVLIKHLPAPEQAQKNAVYLNSFSDL